MGKTIRGVTLKDCTPDAKIRMARSKWRQDGQRKDDRWNNVINIQPPWNGQQYHGDENSRKQLRCLRSM